MLKFLVGFALSFALLVSIFSISDYFNNNNYSILHSIIAIEVSTDGSQQNDKEYFENRGYELYNLGNYSGAIEYYDKVLAMDPNDRDALTNKGSALYSLGNYSESILYYDKILAMDPNDRDALDRKGLALFNLGSYIKAIKANPNVLEMDVDFPQLLVSKGKNLSYSGNIHFNRTA